MAAGREPSRFRRWLRGPKRGRLLACGEPVRRRKAELRLQHLVGGFQGAFHPALLAGPRLSADVERSARDRLAHALRDLAGVHPDLPEMPAAAKRLLRPVLVDGHIGGEDLRRGWILYGAQAVQLP